MRNCLHEARSVVSSKCRSLQLLSRTSIGAFWSHVSKHFLQM